MMQTGSMTAYGSSDLNPYSKQRLNQSLADIVQAKVNLNEQTTCSHSNGKLTWKEESNV